MLGHPNVLLLLTDQHAPQIAGFAGDEVVHTQHLDALASRSVQFETAICAAPVCTPSRMCLLTGKEPHRCAAWNNHWAIFPGNVTWPAHMAAHGYRTCLVGKMHLGGRDQMQGFHHRPYGDLRHGLAHQPDPIEDFPSHAGAGGAGVTQIPESLIQDVVVTRESLAYLLELQDREPDLPWFFCASYARPHPPYTAPGRYIRRYRDRLNPLPPFDKSLLEPYAQRLCRSETGAELPAEVTHRAREAYYACVDFVDDCIGELLEGLDAAGMLDNTIIVYTSDHGEMAGLHGLWGKGIYFEPAVRVPLMISGPGISEGPHRVRGPISLMDLFPTVCGLIGLPVPDGLDGVDFSAVLADPESAVSPRDWVPSSYFGYGVRVRGALGASEHDSHSAMRLVRERDWKYVEIEEGLPLLFDMRNDSCETVNLAGQPRYGERCQRMRKALRSGFSWEYVHRQLAADRKRIEEVLSGVKPTTPNQYMLPDGRIFDAESSLYDVRWLHLPPVADGGGIIPQQFG